MEVLEAKLAKEDDPYEPLAHRVTAETIEIIDEMDLPGIRYVPERWRYYPSGNTFSHVVGFVGFSRGEKRGLYGVEGHLNDALAGYLTSEQIADQVGSVYFPQKDKSLSLL